MKKRERGGWLENIYKREEEKKKIINKRMDETTAKKQKTKRKIDKFIKRKRICK